MFSRSFGYAIRGILYLAHLQGEERKIQGGEIAEELGVPRHFMGKILKNLVSKGILLSSKGPNGGFFINEKTLETTILEVLIITDTDRMFKICSLRMHECSTQNPCPLHNNLVRLREELENDLKRITIASLLHDNQFTLMQGITTRIPD